jgi:hypothetical protein
MNLNGRIFGESDDKLNHYPITSNVFINLNYTILNFVNLKFTGRINIIRLSPRYHTLNEIENQNIISNHPIAIDSSWSKTTDQ